MQYKRVIASLGVVLIDTAFAFYGILAIAICSCDQKILLLKLLIFVVQILCKTVLLLK